MRVHVRVCYSDMSYLWWLSGAQSYLWCLSVARH